MIKTVFRPLVNQFNDNFGSTNSFWNQYFSVNQRDFWEREKRGLISYLSAWGSDQRVLLQNTAQPEKKGIFIKNGKEDRDVRGNSRKC